LALVEKGTRAKISPILIGKIIYLFAIYFISFKLGSARKLKCLIGKRVLKKFFLLKPTMQRTFYERAMQDNQNDTIIKLLR